jgi:hypothetical protein
MFKDHMLDLRLKEKEVKEDGFQLWNSNEVLV